MLKAHYKGGLVKVARVYNLFISHSWAYGQQYEGLINLLNNGDIHYRDYSVPKDDPIHNAKNSKALYEAIKAQISPSSIVIILAGVYSSYSEWIDKEIKIAKTEFSTVKPILAVAYWGAERTSQRVKNSADKVVRWQTSSIVSAIKDLCK